MNIFPMTGFVFVQEEKTSEKTKSGILLQQKGKKTIGKVYVVNNDRGGFFYNLFLKHFSKDRTISLKKGDRIMFSKYVCEDVYIEDENENEVKGIYMLPISMISAIIK